MLQDKTSRSIGGINLAINLILLIAYFTLNNIEHKSLALEAMIVASVIFLIIEIAINIYYNKRNKKEGRIK